MMKIIDKSRREFIARMIVDLGKTIFAIGLASYFFEKFSVGLKFALFIGCIIALAGSIFVQPRREKGE